MAGVSPLLFILVDVFLLLSTHWTKCAEPMLWVRPRAGGTGMYESRALTCGAPPWTL